MLCALCCYFRICFFFFLFYVQRENGVEKKFFHPPTFIDLLFFAACRDVSQQQKHICNPFSLAHEETVRFSASPCALLQRTAEEGKVFLFFFMEEFSFNFSSLVSFFTDRILLFSPWAKPCYTIFCPVPSSPPQKNRLSYILLRGKKKVFFFFAIPLIVSSLWKLYQNDSNSVATSKHFLPWI